MASRLPSRLLSRRVFGQICRPRSIQRPCYHLIRPTIRQFCSADPKDGPGDIMPPEGAKREIFKADSVWQQKLLAEANVQRALTAEGVGWFIGLGVFADSIHPAMAAIMIGLCGMSINMKYVFTQAGMCGMAMRNVISVEQVEPEDENTDDVFVVVKTDMVERTLKLVHVDSLPFESEDRQKPVLPDIVKNRGLMFNSHPTYIDNEEFNAIFKNSDLVIANETEHWTKPWPARMPKPGRLKDMTQQAIDQQKRVRDKFQQFTDGSGEVDINIVFARLQASVIRWSLLINLLVAGGAVVQLSKGSDQY